MYFLGFFVSIAEAGGYVVTYSGKAIKSTHSNGEAYFNKGEIAIIHYKQNVSCYVNYSVAGLLVSLEKYNWYGGSDSVASRVYNGTINTSFFHIMGSDGKVFLRFEVIGRYSVYDIQGYIEKSSYTAMDRSVRISNNEEDITYDEIYNNDKSN
ncbi:hypothetical protein GMA11_07345 [Granulicatella sp. zg-ZJ]|uniref:hypothetical protein n=1 Tax=Granulicatella sp. zg-ZJ TaxID=2678504 RepID=UPI0013D15A77|nr:hypothetical protein [Granulicatella sp. zg-ZJ]NEW63207.1 hypothetical protein [Granulicatella sp. zg-ZJ]